MNSTQTHNMDFKRYHSHYTQIIFQRAIKFSQTATMQQLPTVYYVEAKKRKAEVSLGSAFIKIINCAITC